MGPWAARLSVTRRDPLGPSNTPPPPAELHRLEPGGAEAGAGPDRAGHRGHPPALQAPSRLQRDPQGRSLFPKHGEEVAFGRGPPCFARGPASERPAGLWVQVQEAWLSPRLHGPIQVTEPLQLTGSLGVRQYCHPHLADEAQQGKVSGTRTHSGQEVGFRAGLQSQGSTPEPTP